MKNSELLNSIDGFDRIGYRIFLRAESIKKLFDPTYVSFNSYVDYSSSKFYKRFSYSHYLAENIDKNIKYSEYICESIDKSISYSEYLSENIMNNISYSEYTT